VQPIGDRVVWLTSEQFVPHDEDLHDEIHGQRKNKKKRKKNDASKVTCSLTTLSLLLALFMGKLL
jgi:hypothetical protein